MPRNKKRANAYVNKPASPDSAIGQVKRWKLIRRSNDVFPPRVDGLDGKAYKKKLRKDRKLNKRKRLEARSELKAISENTDCLKQFAKVVVLRIVQSPEFRYESLEEKIDLLEARQRQDLFKFLSANEVRLFIATQPKPKIWWKQWCNVLLQGGFLEFVDEDCDSQFAEWTIEKQMLLRPIRISAKAELWLVANENDVVENLRVALAVAPPPVSTVKPVSRRNLPLDLSTRILPVPDAANIQVSNVKRRKYKSFSSFSVNTPSVSSPLSVDCVLKVLKPVVKRLADTRGTLHHGVSDLLAVHNLLEYGDPNSNSNTQEDSELESVRCLLSLSIEQFNVYISHACFGFSCAAISKEENCSVQLATQYLADCVLSGLPLHLLALEISQEMISDAHTALRWADWNFVRFGVLMSTLPFRPVISAEKVKILISIMRYEYGLATGVRAVHLQTERPLEVISLLDLDDSGNDQLEKHNQHDSHTKQVYLPKDGMSTTRESLSWFNAIATPMCMLQPTIAGTDQRFWSDLPSANKQK